MARSYLKISKESSYGTFASPSTLNTDYVIVRLDQNNAFSMRAKTKDTTIRGFDGLNKRLQFLAPYTSIDGGLNTLYYPEQAAFFNDWATKLTAGDLSSCTCDYAIEMDNGTIWYDRFLGVKVAQYQLSASADSVVARISLQLVGKQPAVITISDLPEPAQSLYPSTNPYLFTDLGSPGFLNLSSSSRTEFSSWELTIKNLLDSPFLESRYITKSRWCGRDADWSAKLIFKSAADRSSYESATAETCSVKFDNGTKATTWNFQGANYQTSVDDDISLDKRFYQTLGWSNFLDASASSGAGNDFTVVTV